MLDSGEGLGLRDSKLIMMILTKAQLDRVITKELVALQVCVLFAVCVIVLWF